MTNRKLSTGEHIIVGDSYAKPMDYVGIVGSECVVLHSMSAICAVVVLTGDIANIGKEIDIHIEDCLPVQTEEKDGLYVIIDLQTGHILYSKDKEFMDFLQVTFPSTKIRFLENIREIHAIMDYCEEDLKERFEKARKENPDFDWIPYCLDEKSPVSEKYAFQYQKYLVFEKKRKADELTSPFGKTDYSQYGPLMRPNPNTGQLEPTPPMIESTSAPQVEPEVEPNSQLTQSLLGQIQTHAEKVIQDYDNLKMDAEEQKRKEAQKKLSSELRKQQAEQEAEMRKEMDEIVAREKQAEKEQLKPPIGLTKNDSDKVDGTSDTKESNLPNRASIEEKENPRPWWLRKILGND